MIGMKRSFLYLWGGLIVLFLTMGSCVLSLPDMKFHLWMLNIGQGDAILIRTPLNQWILVDGGPDEKVVQELSEVMPWYEQVIDVVILSHPHADHANGLVSVLSRYEVRNIVWSGIQSSTSGYGELKKLVKVKGVKEWIFDGKVDYQLGNIVLDNLFPFDVVKGQKFENLNDSSLVFVLKYGKERYLFPGDLETKGEMDLVESSFDLRADVLKVGHHGSKTSSTLDFLMRVRPKLALISCGVKNKFKHPNSEALEHLKQAGVKRVQRTDLEGRVEVNSNDQASTDQINFNI